MNAEFPDLSSERLILVKLGLFGLEDMYEYAIQKEVYSFLEFTPHSTIEDTKVYLNKLLRRANCDNAHYWFIQLKETNKVIGTFGLHDIDWRKRIGEISYGVSPDYSRQGIFTEALLTVLEFCFKELEFHRINATTRLDNIGSIKGLEKCGFSKEGILREYYLNEGGSRYDATILAILRSEYLMRSKDE